MMEMEISWTKLWFKSWALLAGAQLTFFGTYVLVMVLLGKMEITW